MITCKKCNGTGVRTFMEDDMGEAKTEYCTCENGIRSKNVSQKFNQMFSQLRLTHLKFCEDLFKILTIEYTLDDSGKPEPHLRRLRIDSGIYSHVFYFDVANDRFISHEIVRRI